MTIVTQSHLDWHWTPNDPSDLLAVAGYVDPGYGKASEPNNIRDLDLDLGGFFLTLPVLGFFKLFSYVFFVLLPSWQTAVIDQSTFDDFSIEHAIQWDINPYE